VDGNRKLMTQRAGFDAVGGIGLVLTLGLTLAMFFTLTKYWRGRAS
jgi:hypothetical protein